MVCRETYYYNTDITQFCPNYLGFTPADDKAIYELTSPMTVRTQSLLFCFGNFHIDSKKRPSLNLPRQAQDNRRTETLEPIVFRSAFTRRAPPRSSSTASWTDGADHPTHYCILILSAPSVLLLMCLSRACLGKPPFSYGSCSTKGSVFAKRRGLLFLFLSAGFQSRTATSCARACWTSACTARWPSTQVRNHYASTFYP